MWLQVAGAILEGLGLLTVAIGVGEIRAKFTGRPSWLSRLGHGIDRTLDWLSRKLFRDRPDQTIGLEGIGSTSSVGQVQLRRGLAPIFKDRTVDERLLALQVLAQEHEDAISDLKEDLRQETVAREEAGADLNREIALAEERAAQRLADAVAGGISREAAGLSLFTVGLALNTWGSLIS